METFTDEDWNNLNPSEQLAYARLLERSDNTLRALLRLIPECPEHGDQCIPHAREWIKRAAQGHKAKSPLLFCERH